MATNSLESAKVEGPWGRPFRPGQSGNPLGRPKMSETVKRAKEKAAAVSEGILAELHGITKNKRLKLTDRIRAAEIILRTSGAFDSVPQGTLGRILVIYTDQLESNEALTS